jgi:CheY-like chemotaxis protein
MNSTWLHLYLPENPGYVFSSSLPPDSQFPPPGDHPPARMVEARKPRVLVVDDEKIIADTITAILNRSGFDATAKYGGVDAIDFLHKECPDIVLSDVVMPGHDGLAVAEISRNKCPGTRIVLISGNASTPNLLQHALPEGPAFELLAKPIHPTHLLSILRG